MTSRWTTWQATFLAVMEDRPGGSRGSTDNCVCASFGARLASRCGETEPGTSGGLQGDFSKTSKGMKKYIIVKFLVCRPHLSFFNDIKIMIMTQCNEGKMVLKILSECFFS